MDTNNDGRCAFCYVDVEIACDKHIDKDMNTKCDTCKEKYICPAHVDADGDRICDECGGVLGCKEAHVDDGANGYCDICQKLIPTCDACVDEKNNVYNWSLRDLLCDKCGADMVATED